jgi:hypothetical protein
MNDKAIHLDQTEEKILTYEVSDEALEAAAGTTTGPAFTFAGAPTVSVLFACCGNDYISRRQRASRIGQPRGSL